METDKDADHAYSPSLWSHRFTDGDQVIESHVQTLIQATERARTTVPCLLNWPLDTATTLPDHSIDLYFPSNTGEHLPNLDVIQPKAIFVYLHGGYWQFLSRRESAFMAQTMSDEQILTAVVGYPVAPHSSMEQIILCVEQALVKILHWATKLSVKVFVSGHSAGGHLAATLLLIDWKKKYNIDAEVFGGFFLVSGVFDLCPLVPTYVNKPLGLTTSTARQVSPLHRPSEDYWSALKHVPILCVHGEHDPPTFREQNRSYGSYLTRLGYTHVQTLQLDNFDHFDLIEQLENRDQPLTTLILRLIKESL